MRHFLIAVLAVLPTYALSADGVALPDYNVDEKCRGLGKSLSANPSSEIVEKQCVKTEQVAYDKLKRYWAKLDEASKKKCLAGSSDQKLGNYKLLQQCLSRNEVKIDAQAQPSNFKK